MSNLKVTDFLDLEAAVDEDEEEEIDEEEMDDFLHDEDIEDTASERSTRPPSPTPTDYTRQLTDLRSRAIRNARVAWSGGEEIPRQFLAPTVSDPDVWRVRVKPGFEATLVSQIGRRSIMGDQSRSPEIASVFARAGIPGHIFLEGNLPGVMRAIKDMVTVLKVTPILVPLDERDSLLLSRNPLSRPITEGEWVRCLHGLYRNDIGFVCGHDLSRDAETIVALVPRIPKKWTRSEKRKKVARPEPRSWSKHEVEAAWGKAQVHGSSPEDFTFRKEEYKSGLILKRIPPISLVFANSSPHDIRPFVAASFIRNMPLFIPWIHRFAQDSIIPRQRVKVESGEQSGVVGYTFDVNNSVATVIPDNAQSPIFDISLRALTPLYIEGDHIKHRWSSSYGLVMSIDDEHNLLSYIEAGTENRINISTDAVEFYSPPLTFYRLTRGTWVEFNKPGNTEQPKRRGIVRVIEDKYALIIDEHSRAEFKVDMSGLDICGVQGPSLPKYDRRHPQIGERVIVSKGPRKGYTGYIRNVGIVAVMVELDALVTGSQSPYQAYQWCDLLPLTLEAEVARSIPRQRDRSRTPSPSPDSAPARDLTPEPFAGPSSEGNGHWLFSTAIQSVLERRCIPFTIKFTRTYGDGSLADYEGRVARTVPLDKCNSPAKEGEIVVNVVRRARLKQFSIHPKFLEPWIPVIGGWAVVVKGTMIGAMGMIKETHDRHCVINFTVDNDSRDLTFWITELAALEDPKE